MQNIFLGGGGVPNISGEVGGGVEKYFGGVHPPENPSMIRVNCHLQEMTTCI